MSTSAHVFPDRVRSIHAQARSTGIPVHGNRGVKVIADSLIRRSPSELYAFCRKPENLPQFFDHPVAINSIEGRASHWLVTVPFEGNPVEWEVAIINDEPGRLIAWQSIEGAPVPNAGTLRFEPTPAGDSKVTVQLEFDPPGKLAGFFTGMVGKKAKHHVADALNRFKEKMEAT